MVKCVGAAFGPDKLLQEPVQPSGRMSPVVDGLHSKVLQKSFAEEKA